MNASFHRRVLPSLARGGPWTVLAALLVAGCGGGGSGDGSIGGGDSTLPPVGGDELIIGDPGGRDADTLSSDELRRVAARNAARGINLNLANLRRLGADDDSGGGAGEGGAGEMMDGELLVDVERAGETLSARLLGVDDPGARVERDGNVITVDPDDATLCGGDETGLLGDGAEPAGTGVGDGLSNCRRLVTDLSVRLDARSEDSGVITYLFDDAPVLALGYSPGGASSELYLAGLQLAAERLATFERDANGDAAEDVDVPTVLRGALRLDARVLDEREGAQSVELELGVTEALEIGEEGGEAGLSLAPSRVFLLGVDEASETLDLSVAWGALRLAAQSGGSDGGTELTTLELGALTLDLTLDAGLSALSLANVGIGDVPLNVRVGSNDALTLALETFGVTLDAESGELRFDTDLGIELALDNLGGLLDERTRAYTARLVADAPRGTRLVERDDGVTSATEVVAGGPVSVSLVESDETGSVQREVSVAAGSCFGDEASSPGPESLAADGSDPFDGVVPVAGACP